ncbi:hypothetical protein [Mesorhizobium sp. CN2-181]|uniref:hypothetical protein n=1 Tax=Mesorhizobium yinganensis TaxID=3157707 RepID=UPI0032B7F3CB
MFPDTIFFRKVEEERALPLVTDRRRLAARAAPASAPSLRDRTEKPAAESAPQTKHVAMPRSNATDVVVAGTFGVLNVGMAGRQNLRANKIDHVLVDAPVDRFWVPHLPAAASRNCRRGGQLSRADGEVPKATLKSVSRCASDSRSAGRPVAISLATPLSPRHRVTLAAASGEIVPSEPRFRIFALHMRETSN